MKIDDESVRRDNAMRIRSRVGIVFQNPDDDLTPTVEEDIAFGPLNLGCSPKRPAAAASRPRSPRCGWKAWRSAPPMN